VSLEVREYLASPNSERILLEAHGLSRRFGRQAALADVSISLRAGERVALLGPNGSGKTTLIRILGFSLSPTTGSVTLPNQNGELGSSAARRQIGLVAHRTGLYDELSVADNLRFFARLYGLSSVERRISECAVDLGLTKVLTSSLRTLSRGMQQRAALARAILHEPRILLLDEPETGLDAEAQEWLSALLDRWIASGRTALVATHRLEWAGKLADRAVVLKAGRVQAELQVQGPALARAYLDAVGEAA
jgi:heme ABC exporter ATP-binding subunit CcmA